MQSDFQFGIDLGTTNSAVVRSNGVEVHVYRTSEPAEITPSAVRLSRAGTILVGKKAHNGLVDDPDNVATEFKRLMGHKTSRAFPACGRSMTPEELSAEVLKSLKDDVRNATGEEIIKAAVTVPAAFSTLQCEATSRAASLAGITETYLLQEPIAAAIAYGVKPEAKDKRWLVFDLGGGTFDIAVVSACNGQLTVLEHRGNNLLGGKDMDRLIVDEFFLPALNREYQLHDPGSPERQRLIRRLLRHAELTKIELSARKQVVVTLSDLKTDRRGEAIEIEVTVTRSDFERKIEPLVQSCVTLVEEAIMAARVSRDDLDRILLVGGPTQIPFLRAAFSEAIGVELDTSLNPMTVVAQGAAIFAAGVEWTARETTKPVTSSGAVSLQLGYDKVSSTVQTDLLGKVATSSAVEAIKIDADGGFWTSGWIPVIQDSFSAQIQLLEDKLTRYWIYARQSNGALIEIEPDSLSIRHGLQAGAPPLPHSIGLEVIGSDGKPELDIVFRKGTTLPADRVMKYRAARELRPTKPDDYLAVKVWEGEVVEDPGANLWVSAMPIYGNAIRRIIPEGAEIQLAVKIDVSRRITVDVSVPRTNESISDGVYIPEREQQDPKEQVKELPAWIEQLLLRIAAVESQSDESSVLEEVEEFKRRIEDLDLAASQASADDPDLASSLIEKAREIRREVARLEKHVKSNGRPNKKADTGRGYIPQAKSVVEQFGSESEKRELSSLVQELERAEKRGDSRSASKTGERLKDLEVRVSFNQDSRWRASLQALSSPGREFVNRQESQKWIAAGAEALQKGDPQKLREAVHNLWDLLPKSDAESDEEQDMLAGLRRF